WLLPATPLVFARTEPHRICLVNKSVILVMVFPSKRICTRRSLAILGPPSPILPNTPRRNQQELRGARASSPKSDSPERIFLLDLYHICSSASAKFYSLAISSP